MSAQSKLLRNEAAKYLAVVRAVSDPPEKMGLLERAADHIGRAVAINVQGEGQAVGAGAFRQRLASWTSRDGLTTRSAERVGSRE